MSGVTLVSPGVEAHLAQLLRDLQISDFSWDVEAGSTKGDNFLGVIAKVRVKGKRKGETPTTLDLIVKSAPKSEIYRKNFPVRIAYEREIYLYTKVLPEYVRLQQEKRIKVPFVSFAKFYSSSMEDMDEVLVMENMKETGFKLWSRFNPVDFEHALLVLKNYGKLHALSFATKDQNPEKFREFSGNTEERLMSEENTPKEHAENIDKYFERALTSLDPEVHREAYGKFENFGKTRQGKFYEATKSKTAGDYAVVGHGDCWINNLLFKYGDPEKPAVPTEMCFLDWQLSRLGSPALDLAYFIFTCTDKNLRDEHYEELIKEYHSSFSSFLRELGSDPEKLFPFEVLQDHLKRFSVYGLFMAVMILYFISSENDEIPDVNNIKDMEDAKLKFSYESKNIEKYRSRIRGVILDFVKYGYDF